MNPLISGSLSFFFLQKILKNIFWDGPNFFAFHTHAHMHRERAHLFPVALCYLCLLLASARNISHHTHHWKGIGQRKDRSARRWNRIQCYRGHKNNKITQKKTFLSLFRQFYSAKEFCVRVQIGPSRCHFYLQCAISSLFVTVKNAFVTISEWRFVLLLSDQSSKFDRGGETCVSWLSLISDSWTQGGIFSLALNVAHHHTWDVRTNMVT